MATLFDRLSVSLDGGGFSVALGTQVGQFAAIAEQAANLGANPAGLGDFAAGLAGLSIPALPAGAQITAGLNGALGAIPAVVDGAAPDALGELGRFGDLVATRLTPLLAATVAVARGIEGLAGAQFRCPPPPAAGAPAPAPPTPPPPVPAPASPPPGPARLAVANDRAAEISTFLDSLPDPLTPGAVLNLLVSIGSGKTRAATFPIVIPIFEDLVQPLSVLGQWSEATSAQVGAMLAETLTMLRDRLRQASTLRLGAALAGPVSLLAQLHATELGTFATAYLAAGSALADALTAGNAAAATARAGDLNAAVAAFETVRTAMATPFTDKVPAADARLRAAPADVLDSLLHLAIQIEPVNPSSFLPAGAGAPPDPEAAQQLADLLEPITNFLEDLAAKLDLSAITAGVGGVATDCRAIADSINEALTAVAQETRAAFAQVEDVVRELPFDDLANEMRAGIEAAGDALQAAVRSAFEPFREAVASAVGAISDAVDGVDPEAVKDALAQAVAEIAAVLHDPEIESAVAEIRSVLDAATEAAGNLSFAPVTDEVIALIAKMADGLRAVANAELNDALKGLLSAALAVLPADLRPVTQPLVDDFGLAIEQGPVPLLEAIRAKPQELMDLIRGFNPGALAGETLGPPFREAVAALEAFKPSALLAPLDQALDRERARLKAEVAPSRALAPVKEAFDQLLAELDRLSPETLLRPLEEQVEKAIQDVVDASPVDEVFEQINGVFATITALLDTIEGIGDTLLRASTALTSFADPDAALDAWLDAILVKVGQAPNAGALTTLLGEIVAAIDAAQVSELQEQFDAATGPLTTALDGLGAEGKLAAMVAVRQRLRPLVQALPAGANRTTIEQALARFDPLDPAHGGGLRAAANLARAVREARDSLVALGPDFDRLLHGPSGALTALRVEATGANPLRGAVALAAEGPLDAVRFVFRKLGGAAVPAGAIALALADLNQKVTQSVGNILTGPASLQAISDAVQEVVDLLRNIDFGFLREALEGVFQALRGEIEAAGPGPLLIALDREFGEAVDLLDLRLLLPAAEIAALDEAAEELVGKLRALDPEVLVSEAVGPAFEAEVLPLVEALDITPVFDALIEALRGLEADLETELGRVNTAYQALLAARPAGLGASASISLGTG
jgi:hypothetical protein